MALPFDFFDCKLGFAAPLDRYHLQSSTVYRASQPFIHEFRLFRQGATDSENSISFMLMIELFKLGRRLVNSSPARIVKRKRALAMTTVTL
jgi:hypothetical protein